VTTAESNRPALRPAYSVLDTSNFNDTFSWTPPSWEDGLAEFLDALAREPR